MYCTPGSDCRDARARLKEKGIAYKRWMLAQRKRAQVRGWAGGNETTPTFDIDGVVVVDFGPTALEKVLKLVTVSQEFHEDWHELWGLEGGMDGTRPVIEALREARDLGFDSIELGIASAGVLTPSTSQAECQAIVEAAQRIGIEISSLASGENWSSSPTSADPRVRQTIISFTRGALQVAKWLGAGAYLYVPGAVDVFFNPQSEVVPYDVCWNRARESLAAILPAAETPYALENV